MDKTRVVLYGMGPIGIKVAQFLRDRKNIEIAGAIDIDEKKAGRDLSEFTGDTKKSGILVEKNAQKVMEDTNVDIAVVATTSSVEKIKPQIAEILSYGINVVSTCEELSYPWITASATAADIDALAKKNNISVLSTGVNPGFLMDLFPLVMTGVCRDVEQVTAERIQNAANRRIPFQQKVGIGLSLEEFAGRVEAGTLRHVGLTESMHMIASRLGWKLDATKDLVEPVIADTQLNIGGRMIEKGMALGVNQTGRGFAGGKEVITLVFKAAAGIEQSYDRITIKGTPDIEVTVKNGVNGDIATCAMVVNAIPVVLRAAPGLKTMADIEPVAFWA